MKYALLLLSLLPAPVVAQQICYVCVYNTSAAVTKLQRQVETNFVEIMARKYDYDEKVAAARKDYATAAKAKEYAAALRAAKVGSWYPPVSATCPAGAAGC